MAGTASSRGALGSRTPSLMDPPNGVIPANTYKGQTADVPVAKIENYLVTRKGVSTDTVYRMTKAMYEHLDQLVAAHAAALYCPL